MVIAVSGRIQQKDSSSAALGGCRVDVYYDPKELSAGSTHPQLNSLPQDVEAEKTPQRAGRASSRTDASGHFTIQFAEGTTSLGNALHFVVAGPAGQTIGELTVPIKNSTEEIVIPVNTRDIAAIPLDEPKNPIEPVTRRVNGRVLDRNGKAIPAGLQVIVFARKFVGDGELSPEMPVLVVRTDGSGYFFGEVPNEHYARVAAVVAGIKTEILITLDDGLIPRSLPLVVDFPANVASDKKDCGCGTTPRAPDHADFDSAPGTFSNDLGTGNCVQFTTPNRAIEEFDFYSVVRTTEPDIVAFNSPASKPVSMTRSDLLLVSFEATAATAIRIAAATQALADTTAQAAEKAEIAVPETKALVQAFESAISAAARAEVYEALSSRNDGGWSPQFARDKLTTTLIAGRIPSATATLMAQLLIDAVIAIPASTISGSAIWNATDRIMSNAAATARARLAVVMADVTAAKVAALAARDKYAEAAQAAAAAQAALAAKKAELAAQALAQSRRADSKPAGRVALNARNPIDWDDTPTFYQSAEIAHGHLLHFKQVWYADGYSLGDLLYSLPLAPGQKKLISVIDWDRREQTARSENTRSDEAVTAELSRDRDLGEVVTGTLSESSRGGSKSTTAGVGVGTGAAGNGTYQGFNFGALIGVSGGYGEANSSAWQDSARNLASNSLQNLRDRTLQSASAVRGIRSTVVQNVSQGESVRATTEVVANHNHCHAITVQYFEVLRHLKLQHELADVQECLFVPLPMSEFDLDKTLRWRQELRTYLQLQQLAGGFDAARRVATNWSQVDAPLERYADEFIQSLTGELLITVLVPLPPFPERPRPNPADSAADTAQAVADAVNPTTGFLGVVLAIATGGASLIAGAATSGAINASKAAANGARAVADELYAMNNPQERYKKFHYEIVPGVVEGFINQLDLYARIGTNLVQLSGVDFTLVSEYQPGVPLSISLRATLAGQYKRTEISQLVIKSRNGLPRSFRAIVNSATIRYRTNSFEHAFVDDHRVNDDIDPPTSTAVFTNLVDFQIQTEGLGKGATLFTPIDEWEQRRPRTEDQRLTGELIEHLNNNFEYYHHAIWWAMDPNRRYMLLDGFYAPGSQNRSVASVVENRLIGIVGNSVVLPVARGVNLDPRFAPDEKGERVDLIDYYRPDTPVPASRVSLPTRGVFAEAVMGSCNSCEEIDDSRFWRWEDSPIDEPPSIDSISTGTRRAEPSPTTPTAFPTPIVSIQNAPAIPDPIGVGQVLTALGQQSFADITGLAGTQANAAAAYQQALDTAFKFGKEASTLAQQAAMLNSKDKVFNAIDSAEEEGKIDPEAAKKYRNNAFDKMTLSPPPMAEAAPSQPNEWAPWPGVPDNPEPAPVPSTTDPKVPMPKPKPKPKKILPVSIKLRVFVPSEIWEPYPNAQSLFAGWGGPLKLARYNGDNRTFSFDSGTSRAEMEYNFRINTETLEVTEAAAKTPVYGWARVYTMTDTTDRGGTYPEWWETLDAGATPIANLEKKMKHDDSKFFVEATSTRESYEVAFVLKAQPYFPWSKDDLPTGDLNAEVFGITVRDLVGVIADFAAFDIDALIKVTIIRKPNGMLQYSVSGNHDMFPAYELYVNGESAYQWGTQAQLADDNAPEGLIYPMTIEVDQDKVIKTTP